jgi:hypothetical protein
MTAAAECLQKSGVVPAPGPLPDGIGVCRREGARGSVLDVINFLQTPRHVALPRCDEGVAQAARLSVPSTMPLTE